jgi:DNA-binding PadR family transcriptional regulator
MPREKFQTLTEQMYYILLCLKEECYGMDVMDQVATLTKGRVKVGSGTLYHLLEQFAQAGMIRETQAQGRRRCYVLTGKGMAVLESEYRRICMQAADYLYAFRGGQKDEGT